MSKITDGAQAPAWEMDSASGPIRSSDFAGKTYVLYFYPKDDTPEKYGLVVPLGSDPEAKTIEAFESWVQKSLYGREYMGIDRSTFLIKDGVIQRIWRKVKVAGHAQAVLDAARAL